MKRSEIIKLVLDNICGSYELNEDKVSEILNVLEENGMLPPSKLMTYQEFELFKKYSNDPKDYAYVWDYEEKQ